MESTKFNATVSEGSGVQVIYDMHGHGNHSHEHHVIYDIQVSVTSVAVFVGFFIFLLMVVGIVLNTGVIYAILKTKEYKNVFSCFLLSLCISDLLSALVSPLFWYRRTIGFDKWEISSFLCKFYWGIDMTTSCATGLQILACTVVRFIGVKYPLHYKNIHRKHAVYYTIFVWILCFGCVFVPFAYFNDAIVRNRDSHDIDANWASCSDTVEKQDINSIYIMVAFICLLYVPMFVTIGLSCYIVWKVKKRLQMFTEPGEGRNRHRKENQAVKQLMLVVVSFSFGYLPSAVYAIWTRTHERYSEDYEMYDYWILILSYVMLRTSECLDPVVYTIGSPTLKQFSNETLGRVMPCFKFNMKQSMTGSSPYQKYQTTSNLTDSRNSTPLKTKNTTFSHKNYSSNRDNGVIVKDFKKT